VEMAGHLGLTSKTAALRLEPDSCGTVRWQSLPPASWCSRLFGYPSVHDRAFRVSPASAIQCIGIPSSSAVTHFLIGVPTYMGTGPRRRLRPVSVAPCPAFRLSQLVHLGNPLLELQVLALFVAVPLRLAFPRQVVRFESAPIERHQEVCAAVSVRQRELRIPHLIAGRFWRAVIAGETHGMMIRHLVSSMAELAGTKGRRCCRQNLNVNARTPALASGT